jgi:hypothetical protein
MKIHYWLSLVATVSTLGSALFAEQTGTPRRVLAGDYNSKRIGIVGKDGTLEWEYPIRDIHDAWALPNGNLLFQPSWTEILEMNPEHKVVWRYDAAKANGNEGRKVEVHSFQRLDDGNTMIAESGPGRIIEVDRSGKLVKEVKVKVSKPDSHRDTRLVRKLPNGNYLAAQEGDMTVREYNDKGDVVWEYPINTQVFSAVRLPNGNTLMGAGSASKVVEVDSKGKEVWSVGKNELPGITLAWVTMVERLPNGNTTIVNCHAGPDNPQIIEVTPEKKVVWTFKDFKNFGNALPMARILPDRK